MSDKQNNLNKNDDNIQFDKSEKDQQESDRPSVNLGTSPLKRLTPRDPRLAALSDRARRTSEDGFSRKLPVTGKLPDLPESNMQNSPQNTTEDKSSSKSSENLIAPASTSEDAASSTQFAEESKVETSPDPIIETSEKADVVEPSEPTDALVNPANEIDITESSEASNVLAETSEKADITASSESMSVMVEKIEKEDFLDKPETKKIVRSSRDIDNSSLLEKSSIDSDLGKPLEANTISDDTSSISKSSSDAIKRNIDNTPESSDTLVTAKRIPFSGSNPDETDKPQTHSRRSGLDILQDGASFLTFSKRKKNEEPPEKNPDTAVLPDQSPAWKKVIDGQTQGTTGTIGEQREVLFVIRGMIERVVMKDNTTATLGRFDTGTVPNEEIDLIPYGAIDRGVSRRHCEVLLRDNQLHVVDLGSTNGTFLAGIRLKPNEATLLRKGDELLLGRLAVQVLFR